MLDYGRLRMVESHFAYGSLTDAFEGPMIDSVCVSACIPKAER